MTKCCRVISLSPRPADAAKPSGLHCLRGKKWKNLSFEIIQSQNGAAVSHSPTLDFLQPWSRRPTAWRVFFFDQGSVAKKIEIKKKTARRSFPRRKLCLLLRAGD